MIRPLVDNVRGVIRRRVYAVNRFIVYPEHWEPYYNGGCSDPCDMLQGPCACGAWHYLYEWEIEEL